MVETRAADRAHGPCRDLPPLLSTVSAEVQGGVGGKARAARRPARTEDGKDQGGHALHVEHDGGQGPELFSLEEEPGGGLPAPLSEVAGRQDKVVWHVMEDLGSVCPFVQILDLPVPQMMDQFAELLNLEEDVLDAGRLVDRYFQVPELVIEVPKIIIEDVPMRTSVPEPQLAAVCGATRRHSSSWWWRTKFWSSRFFLWTEFNSVAYQEAHF